MVSLPLCQLLLHPRNAAGIATICCYVIYIHIPYAVYLGCAYAFRTRDAVPFPHLSLLINHKKLRKCTITSQLRPDEPWPWGSGDEGCEGKEEAFATRHGHGEVAMKAVRARRKPLPRAMAMGKWRLRVHSFAILSAVAQLS